MPHPVLWFLGGAAVGYVGGVVGSAAYAQQQINRMPEGKRRIVVAAFKDPAAPLAENLITVAKERVTKDKASGLLGSQINEGRRYGAGFIDSRVMLGQVDDEDGGDDEVEVRVNGMIPRIRASTYVDPRVLLGRSIY